MADPRTSVIFVHGFLSSPATWSRFHELLAGDEDLTDLALHRFKYESPIASLSPLRRVPTLDDVADSLRAFLAYDLAAHPNLVLVTHSQGGLVAQRFLARTLAEGRGAELRRVRRVVMFACPNAGSQLALSLRRKARFWRHGQERELRPLNALVAATARDVINRVVHATEVAADRCPIPIIAFAGASDNVVPPTSAKGVFPHADVLPGDHFTIIQPDSRSHRSYTALKHHLLMAVRDENHGDRPRAPFPRPAPPEAPRLSADRAALTTAQVGQIVADLLAVPGMRRPAFRQRMYDLLPDGIADQLPRDEVAQVELVGLVTTLDSHRHLDPWSSLTAALESLVAAGHPSLERLSVSLSDLDLIPRPRPEGRG